MSCCFVVCQPLQTILHAMELQNKIILSCWIFLEVLHLEEVMMPYHFANSYPSFLFHENPHKNKHEKNWNFKSYTTTMLNKLYKKWIFLPFSDRDISQISNDVASKLLLVLFAEISCEIKQYLQIANVSQEQGKWKSHLWLTGNCYIMENSNLITSWDPSTKEQLTTDLSSNTCKSKKPLHLADPLDPMNLKHC